MLTPTPDASHEAVVTTRDISISTLSIVHSEAEWLTIQNSEFSVFHGFTPIVFLSHILPFLEATEVVTVGRTCKYFYRLHLHPSLWRNLYRHDFFEDNTSETTAPIEDLGPPDPGLFTLQMQEEFLAYLQYINPELNVPSHLTNNELSFTHDLLPTLRPIARTASDSQQPSNALLLAPSTSASSSSVRFEDSFDGGAALRRYVQRRHDCTQRMKRSDDDHRRLAADMRRMDYVRWIESFLDWSQLRMQPLVWFGGWFVTIVLFTEKLDGLDIPYWSCAVPLTIALLYCMGCLWMAHYVHSLRFDTRSLWYGLYSHMTGPVNFVYAKVLHHSLKGIAGFCLATMLILLQMALVVVKLSSNVSSHLQDGLVWALVFLPLWILFATSCMLPLLFRDIDIGAFVTSIVLLWIPLFIILVGVTVKLDHVDSVRMAYFFIPLFIYEGLLMFGTLLFLIFAIYRYVSLAHSDSHLLVSLKIIYVLNAMLLLIMKIWWYRWRKGFYPVPTEPLAMFSTVWTTLSPFVVFQVLICVRDDRMMDGHSTHAVSPTATQTIVPILIVLGWATLATSYIALVYRTPFQVCLE